MGNTRSAPSTLTAAHQGHPMLDYVRLLGQEELTSPRFVINVYGCLTGAHGSRWIGPRRGVPHSAEGPPDCVREQGHTVAEEGASGVDRRGAKVSFLP